MIYGASISFRAIRLRRRISVFEIGQALSAFLLAAYGVLRFGADAGAPVLGALCLLFSFDATRLLLPILTASPNVVTITCMPPGVRPFSWPAAFYASRPCG